MIDNFATFNDMVRKNFDRMVKSGDVFMTSIPYETIWNAYLKAFPEGTNPIYKERTEHDCSCCRHFIRDLGAAVTIDKNGNLHSIWDIGSAALPYPYDVVASALSDEVKSFPINGVFRTQETRIGTPQNRQRLEDGSILTWEHFACDIPRSLYTTNVDEVRGNINTTVQILSRGLKELSIDAMDDVMQLIDGNLLYRGAEHKTALKEFRSLKAKYDKSKDKNTFVWANHMSKAARFRNSVIGTLIIDLSEGVMLEDAVKSFEAKVAPSNYRRTSALITKGMIEKALSDVAELGLESALERRHAIASDVSVNDVLFASRSTTSVMKNNDLSSLLMDEVVSKAPAKQKNVVEMSMDRFIDEILPNTKKLSLLFENRHQGNLVNLTAPVHSDSALLLKWDNPYAWSYIGNLTDSIKMRVKAAGGNVSGIGRVSLSWYNLDDLDLHVNFEDIGRYGETVYFGHKRGRYATLDVDMNICSSGENTSRSAVENVVWANTLPKGTYTVMVNQFTKRESIDVGFTIETEFPDGVRTFTYDKAVRAKDTIPVVQLTSDGNSITKYDVMHGIKEGYSSKEQWGIKTEEFHEVEMMLLSPNCWNGKVVGNKHWIFALKGCRNPDPILGFYNEFLRPELIKHRKVFEILSNKMKCEPSEQQLSGLGFSSTIKNDFMVKVEKNDSSTRTYKIVIQ